MEHPILLWFLVSAGVICVLLALFILAVCGYHIVVGINDWLDSREKPPKPRRLTWG